MRCRGHVIGMALTVIRPTVTRHTALLQPPPLIQVTQVKDSAFFVVCTQEFSLRGHLQHIAQAHGFALTSPAIVRVALKLRLPVLFTLLRVLTHADFVQAGEGGV